MKILIFNNGYLSEGVSGGDKHVIDIAEVWARDHEVTFMLPDFAATRIISGIKTINYPSFKPESLVGVLYVYFVRLLRAISVAWCEKADVVITSVGFFDLLPAVLHRMRNGTRVAVYVFHLIPRRRARSLVQAVRTSLSRIAQTLSIYWFKKCDTVFACNKFVKQGLVDLGVPAEKVVVTRLSVNVQGVRDAEPVRKCQALFIGRIVAAKGVYDLIEAVKDLDVNVGMVGDGPEMANIKRLIKEYKMEDRVELLGYLPDNKPPLYSYLKGCDFFLFPSHEEGYGIVLAEAIIANKPVIAYELPHYREAFGEGLILCPIGDIDRLRENIKALISNQINTGELIEKYKNIRIFSPEQAANADLQSITR